MVYVAIFVPITLLVALTIMVCCFACTRSDDRRALATAESEERKLKLIHQAESDKRADAENAADAAVERQIRLKDKGILVSEINANVVSPPSRGLGMGRQDDYGYR